MEELDKPNYEPKFSNRFFVTLPEIFNIESWEVKSISKPKYIDGVWQDIEITFLDPINKSTSVSLFNLIKTVSDNNLNNVQKEIEIDILDKTGVAVEKWKIPFYYYNISTIDFGYLDYDSNAIVEPKLIFKPTDCILVK
jgi:hypothetical protein